jgi:HEAT repeat protein
MAGQTASPAPPAKAVVAAPSAKTAVPPARPAKKWAFEMPPDFEMERLKADLAALEFEMAGLDMHLKAVPPMPPLPPMEALEELPHKLAVLAELPEKMAPLAELPPMAPIARLAGEYAMLAQAAQPPQPAPAPQHPQGFGYQPGKPDGRADSYYSRGTQYLDRREWERALEAFDQVIERKGTRADGAHYWKAYALNKLGKRTESLAALDALRKNHAGSRWLNDAQALEVEVKQASGRPVSPDALEDDDIKLIAINSLMNSDPERAVPLLERTLQQGNSPKLKERALFVLASAGTPRSREVVGRIAKGGSNPDLQVKAVEYLGIHRGSDNSPLLQEVYQSTQEYGVKKAVLRAFMIGRQKDRLLAVAKSETNPELRREAIHLLSVSGGVAEIGQLFANEQDPEIRRAMVRAFMTANQFDKLAEISRTDKDVNVRREAIRHLGHMDRGRASEVLVSLYGNESDRQIRQEIARGLFHQENARALIDIARKENDLQVKRDIVRMLSNMDTKEARDFLAELLR